MIKERNIRELAATFRLLGDPTRLSIMVLLAEEETNVSDLCKKLRLPQPTVSHHLGLLRSGNLVVGRRAGKEVYYSQATGARAALKGRNLQLGPIVASQAKR